MAYCAQSDIENEITTITVKQLTDDENTGAVNAARVTDAIADADDEINSYVAKQYTVPLSPAPGAIKHASVVLAVHRLYLRRGKEPEHWAKEVERILAWLNKVGKGEVTLGVQPKPPTSGETGGTKFTGETRVFKRESMDGF